MQHVMPYQVECVISLHSRITPKTYDIYIRFTLPNGDLISSIFVMKNGTLSFSKIAPVELKELVPKFARQRLYNQVVGMIENDKRFKISL